MAPRTGNNSNSVRSYDRRKILVNLYLHTSIFQKYSSKYQLDLNTLILINSYAIWSLRNLTYKTHSLYSIYISLRFTQRLISLFEKSTIPFTTIQFPLIEAANSRPGTGTREQMIIRPRDEGLSAARQTRKCGKVGSGVKRESVS